MSFLLKTTLIHLKKNGAIASVLSFFVACGTSVLSSVDNLSSNLDKGFKEINFDSNPHDLVLVSQAFKPSQNLSVEPQYINSLKSNKFSLDWGYRLAFESIRNDFFVKSEDKSKLDAKSTENEQQQQQQQQQQQPKQEESAESQPSFVRLGPQDFSVPSNTDSTKDYSGYNYALLCSISSSFIGSLSLDIRVLDRNRLTFYPEEIFRWNEYRWAPGVVNGVCPNNWKVGVNLGYFWNVFRAMTQHYQKNIAASNTSSDATRVFDDNSADKKADIHRMLNSFNPKRFWTHTVSNASVSVYMPFVESDFYLSTWIPLEIVLGGQDVKEKFLKLANSMVDPAIFYKLDDPTRRSIENFISSGLFRSVLVKYYFSSFSKDFSKLKNLVLPKIEGLNFNETLIILLKLILWDLVKENKENKENKEKNLVNLDIEEQLKWKENSTKEKLKSLISSWNDTDGIDNWKPFELFGELEQKEQKEQKEQDKKPTKSEDYIFSVLKAKSKISELKKTSSTSSTSIYQDTDTLLCAVKKTLVKWLDSDSSTTDIPSTTDATSTTLPKFEDVYKRLYEYITEQVKEYIISLSVNNLKEIREFINANEIFTLSFLLHSFAYNPVSYEPKRRKRDETTSTPKMEISDTITIPKLSSLDKTPKQPDDFSVSVNYHKSLVVNNSQNASSKLNDPTKNGHSFKVISQQRKDDAYVNRPKIISGNPLFEAPQDYYSILKKYSTLNSNQDDQFASSGVWASFFKILSRAKYKYTQNSDLMRSFYEYVSAEYDDLWNDEKWISFDQSREWTSIRRSFLLEDPLSVQGSKVIINLKKAFKFKMARTLNVHSKLTLSSEEAYIDHFSAYFTLVSPFYAQKNNIKPISNEQYAKFKKIVEGDDVTQEEWEKEYQSFILNPRNQDSIINVSGNQLIVVGTAMSPDMVLPSHSYLNLVPNKEKEALLFVDNYGYNHIKYNSLSVWDEFYLSLAYPQIVRDSGKEEDFRMQLTDYIEDFLGSPDRSSREFDLRLAKSDGISKNLVNLRSSYVDHFLTSVNALSSVMLTFIGVVVFFTIWILIRKYISGSLNTFGIFVANGVYRKQIIFSSSMFIIIPAVLGIVIGYFLSLAMQPSIFALVSDIWYLSPVFNGFNVSSLFYYAFVIFSFLIPLSWISSFFMMKDNVSQLMKSNVIFKHNKITEWIYRFFKHAPSLWKFRMSVIMNTAGRGMILSFATVFLFVFSSFLFNNLGQLKKVSEYEIAVKDYGFSMAFETPSDQSGQPTLSSYSDLGNTFLDSTKHSKDVVVKKNGKWVIEKIEFDDQNPEIVATGIKSLYTPSDLVEFFKQCKDKDLKHMYKKLGVVDFNYLSNSFEDNPYNTYMFGKSLSKKSSPDIKSTTDTGAITINCDQGVSENYTVSDFKLPVPTNNKMYIWPSDLSADNKHTKFNPQNVILENLGDYVPVKDEFRGEKKIDSSKTQSPKEYEMLKYEMLKYGDEPLFKPLIEYYKKAEPLLINNDCIKINSSDSSIKTYSFADENSSENDGSKDVPVSNGSGNSNGESGSAKKSGDFLKLGESNYHPTLKRLFKDHSNYLLFSYHDLISISKNPTFLRNKIIMPILFNNEWTIKIFGSTITFNPWNEFSEFFSRYSPELVAAMDTNYASFIDKIIRSRYGEFFVNRFMTKHTSTNSATNHIPGKEYFGKKTWHVSKDILDAKNKGSIEEGFYWFDSSKVVYFYEQLQSAVEQNKDLQDKDANKDKHPDRFVIFRPDFLYLFYALMKDPEFTEKNVAPMKIAFHQNVYTPDYSKFGDSWKIKGKVEDDQEQKKGLTASHNSPKYTGAPSGDQTYTYVQISWGDSPAKMIGLKQDSRGTYVKLSKDGQNINHKLYETGKYEDGSYPVIINHYTSRNLGVSEGSIFEVDVLNTSDRFTKQIKGENHRKKIKLRVVDIYDSYYENSFFISQKNANKIIGLDEEYGYNGMYTKKSTDVNDLPTQLTTAVSGYSPTGIYAKQRISKTSSSFLNFLNGNSSFGDTLGLTDSPFYAPKNKDYLRLKMGLKDGEMEDVDMLATNMDKVYGSGNFSLASSIVGIENASILNDFIFNTVSDLVISVINLFISIFTPLLVCALLIITTLIIEDLKNLLTILNLLGFTHVENSITILLYLGLILAFSTFIGLPLSSLLLSIYVNGVFNTLSIYLPIYLRFDYAMLSFAILAGMFGFSYWTSMRKIKSLYLPIAMKSLNE